MDGSDPDPFGQVSAVREVLTDIGAGDVAEQLVINKIDLADEGMLQSLRTRFPGAVFASARTGEGLDEVRAVVEKRLPVPGAEVTALVPYARGDLIDRIHREGELLTVEHTAEGTLVVARVHDDLAGELAGFPA